MRKTIKLTNKEELFKARCVLSRILGPGGLDLSVREKILQYMVEESSEGILYHISRHSLPICELLGITVYSYNRHIKTLKKEGLIIMNGPSYILHPLLCGEDITSISVSV